MDLTLNLRGVKDWALVQNEKNVKKKISVKHQHGIEPWLGGSEEEIVNQMNY